MKSLNNIDKNTEKMKNFVNSKLLVLLKQK